jgi:hypothetical protein
MGVGAKSSGIAAGSLPPKAATELVKMTRGTWPSAFQQVARGVQVDAHAQVEIGLGCAADHGGQMEYRLRVAVDGTLQHGGIGDVAGEGFDSRVVQVGGSRHVEQHQLVDGAAVELAAFQQFPGQLLAEKAGAAGDQYPVGHACLR